MDPLAPARAALPPWTGFIGLLYWPAAVFTMYLIVSWLITRIGLRSLRRPPQETGLHWTERARISYPVRAVLGVSFILSIVLPVVLSGFFRNPFARAPGWLTLLGTVAGGCAGSLLGSRRAAELIKGTPASLREQLRGGLVLAFLYLPTIIVFSVVAAAMPERMESRAWLQLGIGAVVMALLVWRSGVPILRLLRLARPASERLRRIVDEAAERVGKRPAAVWEVAWPAANAMALPFCNELVFTDGLLRILDDEQLATVAAHELGHLAEPLRVKAARTFGAWILLALATAAPIYRTYGWMGLGILYIVFLAVVICLRRMARRMEVRADAIGGQGAGSAIYARALEKLYEHNVVPAVMRGRLRVHPSLWDRMAAAGAQPDYPRPAPPSRVRSLALYAVVLFVLVLGWMTASRLFPHLIAPRLLPLDQSLALQIGLDGDLFALRNLAALRAQQGRQDESIALLTALLILDPGGFDALEE